MGARVGSTGVLPSAVKATHKAIEEGHADGGIGVRVSGSHSKTLSPILEGGLLDCLFLDGGEGVAAVGFVVFHICMMTPLASKVKGFGPVVTLVHMARVGSTGVLP